jgi:hypothetical protein
MNNYTSPSGKTQINNNPLAYGNNWAEKNYSIYNVILKIAQILSIFQFT